MINKEFILNADGSIKKDFQDRNIPQYANNQVSVNVLIPASCFTGLQNYAVILGVSRIVSGDETTLNSLVMTASKSITIDGVLYVKYSAILSYSYTELLGTLKVSPYIQTTATTTINDESVEVISIQQSFTNSNLNVIKSVLPQYDASMQEANVVSTIEAQLNAKKIYTFIDSDASSLGEHYYNLASSYDPNATQFEGCLVMSIYDNETRQYMPYLNDGDVELLEITKDGKFYRISGVDYSNSTYTYTRLQLSYSKSEIDSQVSDLQTQINGKVDKTTKVNGYALSGDVNLTKGDVGLGNVANFGVDNTPSATGNNKYITSKAVYDALQTIYGIISNMATDETITDIQNRLSAIETLIGDNDGDDDNILNTLKEIITSLSGLGEDANILSLINSKASTSDLTSVENQIHQLLSTTTAPTESGDDLIISTSDIVGTSKENDLLMYIDSDNITTLYKITNITNGTAALSLVGNFATGGGVSNNSNGFYQTNETLDDTIGNTTTLLLTDIETNGFDLQVGDYIIGSNIIGIVSSISNSNVYVETTLVLQVNESVEAPTLLWTNPAPNGEFAGATVNVPNLSNYDYILLEWRFFYSDNSKFELIEVNNANTGYTMSALDTENNNAGGRILTMDLVNNQITFTSGILRENLSSKRTFNYMCVPVKIYGTNDLSTNAYNVEGTITYTDIYVGATETYTNIKDVLDSITDNSKNNRYRIHIKEGTYNVPSGQNAFGLKNYVYLMGENKATCIIKHIYSTTSYSSSKNGFDLSIYQDKIEEASIENLTIITQGCKAPIHIDNDYNYLVKGGKITISNCILKDINTTSNVGIPWEKYGFNSAGGVNVGLRDGQCVEVYDTISNGMIYAHNVYSSSRSYRGGARFKVVGCTMMATTIGDLDSGAHDVWEYENNKIKWFIINYNNSGGASNPRWSIELKLKGNKLGRMYSVYGYTYSLNQEFKVFADLFNGKWAFISNDIHNFAYNHGASNISKATLVEIEDYEPTTMYGIGVKPITSNFKKYGYALEDINVGEIGVIQTSGIIRYSITDPCKIGDKLTYDSANDKFKVATTSDEVHAICMQNKTSVYAESIEMQIGG